MIVLTLIKYFLISRECMLILIAFLQYPLDSAVIYYIIMRYNNRCLFCKNVFQCISSGECVLAFLFKFRKTERGNHNNHRDNRSITPLCRIYLFKNAYMIKWFFPCCYILFKLEVQTCRMKPCVSRSNKCLCAFFNKKQALGTLLFQQSF